MTASLALSSIAFRVLFFLFAVAVLLALEWFLDYRRVKRRGTRIGTDAYSLIDDTPLSLAIYRGLQFVGLCVLAGMLFA